MSTIMAVEANGALSSALQGLRGAGRQVSSVSEEISNINTQDSGSNRNNQIVSMSEQLRDALNSKTPMEQMFPALTSAGTTYTSNLQVVDGLDNLTKSTFSMVI